MDNAPALKFCPCCSIMKPAPDYSSDQRNKDGLNYRCKACHAGHVAKMRALNPEHYQNSVRRYRQQFGVQSIAKFLQNELG